MNIDEIRANKPEGATHYDKGGDYWKVVSNKESYFHYENMWVRYAFDHNEDMKQGLIKPL